MVEGNKDVRYFMLASRLHQAATGRVLVDNDLSIFAAGSGEHGGVAGICEHFPPLRRIIDSDMNEQGKAMFRVITLLDDDHAGRRGAAELERDPRLTINRDVFLLKRVYPRRSSEPGIVAKHITEANKPWDSLDCTIEDLISASFLEAFIAENPNAIASSPLVVNGETHYPLTPHGKDALGEFVKSNAMLTDLERLVETLKSLRHYLGLPTEGN
jgi:hypothetical protein